MYTYPLRYFHYFQLVSEKNHALQVCSISIFLNDLPWFTIHPSGLSKSALSVLWFILWSHHMDFVGILRRRCTWRYTFGPGNIATLISVYIRWVGLNVCIHLWSLSRRLAMYYPRKTGHTHTISAKIATDTRHMELLIWNNYMHITCNKALRPHYTSNYADNTSSSTNNKHTGISWIRKNRTRLFIKSDVAA